MLLTGAERQKCPGDLDADFGFTADYYHASSAFCLTLYRAYDPSTGRWLNRDPIQERGGLNLYAYVNNNPVDRKDTLGLSDDHTLVKDLVNQTLQIKDVISAAEMVNAEDPPVDIVIEILKSILTDLGIDAGSDIPCEINHAVTSAIEVAVESAAYNQNSANPDLPAGAATQAATAANAGMVEDFNYFR